MIVASLIFGVIIGFFAGISTVIFLAIYAMRKGVGL